MKWYLVVIAIVLIWDVAEKIFLLLKMNRPNEDMDDFMATFLCFIINSALLGWTLWWVMSWTSF